MLGEKKTEQERAMLKESFKRQLLYYDDAKKNNNIIIANQSISKLVQIIEKCKGIKQYDLAAIFAIETARKLAQFQNQEALLFVDSALENAQKSNNRKLQRDITYKSAENYSKLQMNEKAAELYLESRQYTDVVVDKNQELQELLETGEYSLFGLTGDSLYAMATFQAANHMDPKKDETIETYIEARKYFEKDEKRKDFLYVLDFRLGKALAVRKEYTKALKLLEEVKKQSESDSKNIVDKQDLDMSLMYVRQKIQSGKSNEYIINVPNRAQLKDTAGIDDLFDLAMKLNNFDQEQGQLKILQEISRLSSKEREIHQKSFNERMQKAHLEPLTDEALKEKANLFYRIAEIEEKNELNLRAFYDYATTYSLLNQIRKRTNKKLMENALKNVHRLIQKLPYSKDELWLRFYNNVTISLHSSNPEKAIELGQKWQELANKMGNIYFEAGAFITLGQAYGKENLEKAKIHFENGLKLFEELEDKMSLIEMYSTYAEFLLEIGDKEGQKYQVKSDKVLEEMVSIGATIRIKKERE